MRAENPWWDGGRIRDDYRELKPRAYFERFARLVEETAAREREAAVRKEEAVALRDAQARIAELEARLARSR